MNIFTRLWRALALSDTWDELEHDYTEDSREYHAWQRKRLRRFPNSPNIDISYELFNLERHK